MQFEKHNLQKIHEILKQFEYIYSISRQDLHFKLLKLKLTFNIVSYNLKTKYKITIRT